MQTVEFAVSTLPGTLWTHSNPPTLESWNTRLWLVPVTADVHVYLTVSYADKSFRLPVSILFENHLIYCRQADAYAYVQSRRLSLHGIYLSGLFVAQFEWRAFLVRVVC